MSENNNGFEDAMFQLNGLMKVDDKVSMGALQDAAEFFAAKLRPAIPKSILRKSHMKDMLEVVVKDDRIQVVFQGKAFYWYFIEHGTSKMRAKPFVVPTFETNKKQIENIMVGKIMKEM
ncbi:HK97-gp10 family putative phage morphogenesis protein [Listeria booriae]|uniref:HK97-gp10 family putative phage morphogenesis protein n=1 Tax=Listeria booriae TaxID=1552123 RepID=UPI001C8BC514|nr:HK97-gp10 family putative phage morphogenesis protein [Listeria booriae]